jgi:hypothetical protein
MPLYNPTDFNMLTTDHMLNIFNAFTRRIGLDTLPSTTTRVGTTNKTQVEVTLPNNGELSHFSKFTFHGYWDTSNRIEYPQISTTRKSKAVLTRYFQDFDAANEFDKYLESVRDTPQPASVSQPASVTQPASVSQALETLKRIKELLDTFYQQLTPK